jgi:hypothetical protein
LKGGIIGKMEYKITEKFTPEVIDEIIEIQKEKGLTAETILDEAKKKSSPLHNFFDWDNTTAGEKWRLQQARILINEVKIIVNSKEMYAFENVRIIVSEQSKETETTREYKPIMEILSKEEYRTQVIKQALENITYWKEKYSEYSELKPIFVSIDKVKKKWQSKK